VFRPPSGGNDVCDYLERRRKMGILWTVLAVIGLIVVLQYIF
jgi:hypothetical protein